MSILRAFSLSLFVCDRLDCNASRTGTGREQQLCGLLGFVGATCKITIVMNHLVSKGQRFRVIFGRMCPKNQQRQQGFETRHNIALCVFFPGLTCIKDEIMKRNKLKEMKTGTIARKLMWLAENHVIAELTCANGWQPRMHCVGRQRQAASRERHVYQDGVREGTK